MGKCKGLAFPLFSYHLPFAGITRIRFKGYDLSPCKQGTPD